MASLECTHFQQERLFVFDHTPDAIAFGENNAYRSTYLIDQASGWFYVVDQITPQCYNYPIGDLQSFSDIWEFILPENFANIFAGNFSGFVSVLF